MCFSFEEITFETAITREAIKMKIIFPREREAHSVIKEATEELWALNKLKQMLSTNKLRKLAERVRGSLIGFQCSCCWEKIRKRSEPRAKRALMIEKHSDSIVVAVLISFSFDTQRASLFVVLIRPEADVAALWHSSGCFEYHWQGEEAEKIENNHSFVGYNLGLFASAWNKRLELAYKVIHVWPCPKTI